MVRQGEDYAHDILKAYVLQLLTALRFSLITPLTSLLVPRHIPLIKITTLSNAISPQGTVSYISQGWASDEYITEHSTYTPDNLVPEDTLLADRGFDSVCWAPLLTSGDSSFHKRQKTVRSDCC